MSVVYHCLAFQYKHQTHHINPAEPMSHHVSSQNNSKTKKYMSAVAGKCLRKKYLIQRLINQFGLIVDPVPWNYDSWHWNKLLKFSDFIHDGFSRQFNLIITTCLTSLLQAFIDWKYQNKMNLYYLQKQFVKRFLFSDDFSEEKQVCNWHLWLWLCRLGLMKMQMKQLTLFYSISRTKFIINLLYFVI